MPTNRPRRKKAVPALIAALAKDTDKDVRSNTFIAAKGSMASRKLRTNANT
jgi:hypothetical protein